MGLDLLDEHVGVDVGVEHEERGREGRRERAHGLRDSHLSTGHLGGVAGDEVVSGLLGCELGDGREDAEGVAREEDDVLGLAGHARDDGVGDEFDRVGRARVLGDADVVVVDHARVLVVDNVLEHGAEADGVEDLGLLLGVEIDRLGVATALHVEHALVVPAVHVIAHEAALGVGGQGGLAGAAEAEEERDVALGTRVGAAVKREHALLGHDVVHEGEDALLHLAGVLGAKDDHLAPSQAQAHAGGRCHSLCVSVGRELAGVVDDEVGLAEVEQLLVGRAHHHVADEQGVVGTRADDAHLELVLGHPAHVAVDHVEALPRVQVIDGALTVDHERVVAEREVDGTPPDVLLRRGLLDDALVLRAAAGVLAGLTHEGAGRGHRRAAFVLEGQLVELRHTGVANDVVDVNAGVLEAHAFEFLVVNLVPLLGRQARADLARGEGLEVGRELTLEPRRGLGGS